MKNITIAIIAIALSACNQTSSSEEANDVWGAPNTEEGSDGSQSEESGGMLSQVNGNSEGSEGPEEIQANPAAEPARKETSFANCGKMYPAGMEPTFSKASYAEAMKPSYKVLCYRAFSVGHSGRTRTALWSAEMLDPTSMNMAKDVARSSDFKPDPNLPEDERSELDDYRRSGWQRGHLAPSADMPTLPAQAESFYLSNIVPQNGPMNGGPWRELETRVRGEAYKRRVYVVTGPLFKGAKEALRKRVLIPTAMYKAMYIVDKGAVVFIVENNKNANAFSLTVDQFSQTYGIDPFPGLTGIVRSHNIANSPLPMPEPKNKTADGESQAEAKDPYDCLAKFKSKTTGNVNYYNVFKATENREPLPSERLPCD